MTSSLSSSPSSPPRLDHSTLNLLDSFMSQRSEKQAKLHRIQMEAARLKLSDSVQDHQQFQAQGSRQNHKQDSATNGTEKQEEEESSDDSGEEGDEQDSDFSEDERQETKEAQEQREEEEKEEEDRLLEAEALADLERLVQLEYEEELEAGNVRGSTPPSLTRIMPLPSVKSKSKSKSRNRSKTEDEKDVGMGKVDEKKGLLTVDEFREIFTEDYQISQFWYSTPFSHKVSKLIKSLSFLNSNSIILYISSPTLYVSHVSLFGQSNNVFLFEYDQRFASIAKNKDGSGTQFFKYDLNSPEKVLESLKGKVDLIVIDPPFLNEVSNELIGKSVKLLLKPPVATTGEENGGKVLLITGVSIGDQASKYYQDEKDPSTFMKRTKLEVEHESGLANPFGAWANFDDAENWGE